MSGTKGSSGFGSQSKEHIDRRTEIKNKKAGVIPQGKKRIPTVCSLKTSTTELNMNPRTPAITGHLISYNSLKCYSQFTASCQIYNKPISCLLQLTKFWW